MYKDVEGKADGGMNSDAFYLDGERTRQGETLRLQSVSIRSFLAVTISTELSNPAN